MNSKVFVTADETGAVINVSDNNSEYGYVRVQQTRTMIDDNGFARRKTITALMFNEAAVDTTIEHDNVEQLRAAYAASKATVLTSSDEDFTIEG